MLILRDISFLWSMLHTVVLFLILFEPRCTWRTALTVGFAGVGTLLVVNVLLMYHFGGGIVMSASFLTCTIPTLLIFFLLSKYRDGRFFFLFCLTDTMCFWVLQITNLLDRATGSTYAVMLLSRLASFPLVEWIFWKYLRRPYMELQNKLTRGWWMFAAIGGTYYLLMMATAIPVGAAMPNRMGMIRLFLVMLLMPLTYLTILNSLWRQMQIYEGACQLDIQRRDYRAIQQKMELGRMFRHDTRHHLLVLDGMLQQGDTASARQYIQSLRGKIASLSETNWCANHAVNAVLSGYIVQAEEAGCQMKVKIRIPRTLPYGELDLCIILANALENAVQACRDNGEGDRWINVQLEMTDTLRFTLSVENACPQPVLFDENGFPVPTGQAPGEHGLGLRSVRALIDRYGGLFRCRWEDGQFNLRAVLFPPETNKP